MSTVGVCYGEASPNAGITPRSWTTWEIYPSAHTPATVYGDADYGWLSSDAGVVAVSEVFDTAQTASLDYAIAYNVYGYGEYGFPISVRGSLSPFDVQATHAELAWEALTVSPITRTWRYLQLRIDNDLAPTPTPAP